MAGIKHLLDPFLLVTLPALCFQHLRIFLFQPPIQTGIDLLHAIRTDAVSKSSRGVFPDIGFKCLPVAFVVPYLPAPGGTWAAGRGGSLSP
jgi:hypothetical protein